MISVQAQVDSTDYYYDISDYPSSYSANTVAARMVDGLGFRYYWGSEGLSESDLSYRPSEGARNTLETLQHILVLSQIISNTINEKPFAGMEVEGLSYQEIRNRTLENLKVASETLQSAPEGIMEAYTIDFTEGNTFPFWNLINGPIADAINHVGQIITFRRTNGNPIDQNISVLRGSRRN
ncbi:MAG: hypothetical protein Tsb0034_05220 [Ekhidna sp.]